MTRARGLAPTGRSIALLLPGQGAQHPGMAAGLYGVEPVFTATMDEIFHCYGALGDELRADWLSDSPSVPVDDLRRSQPLLFAVNVAMGRTVLDWGVRPVALLGHSVGEMSAAVLAGVFDLDDAVALMTERVARIAEAPPGGMLAVGAPAAELRGYLRGGVVVAAVNAPNQTLLAGQERPLERVHRALDAAGYTCLRAKTTSAFHSPAVAPACARTLPAFCAVPMSPPRIRLYSGYTADVLREDQATDPEFWCMQPAEPVLFAQALDRLLADHRLLLMEVGPSQGLTALARRHPDVVAKRSAVVPLLPGLVGTDTDPAVVGAAAARLRAEGHDLAA